MLLPTTNGTLEDYTLTGTPLVPRAPQVPLTRTAFAAAHVISDPLAERDPWVGRPAVDWDATLKFREDLWDQGLGLAEAMDTSQRGMGVDWPTARELIERTMAAARAHPTQPRVACGAGTDHAAPEELTSLAAIRDAYMHQMEAVEAAGGQIILMATRALPAIGAGPEDYARLYDDLISQAQAPVILHWLGEMFDPALAGYWGSTDIETANKVVHDLIARNAAKVDGLKISLLDQSHEETFRAALPEGVRLYTGDDFNFAALIEGDGTHYSHALLGIFAAIAPAASQALEALARDDHETYNRLLAPTVPLGREIFKAPTQFYKAGIAYLAWLNGQQSHFVMPGGFQSSREITHFAQVFRLADQARLLTDPDLAQARMRNLLALHGIDS
ncbi:dihydrodipicolinate synthase family protein [Gymnodinialimonas ceratoperidinii]|uniref:Dihydrodipicolinate synthase family protein n=1 Tax=Gymnodinialimonas ceratoperidinii TaxID=2856823 RepID=A0A8F6TWN6_9RHOB|nr:dihydrodipicolinate synthase family protein [Gymnodinialimonas ceratoperidinii]QXT40317.1 dihydrodipicolinate synthase family protein [Gymnodinialimonas ceratoperidinii]